MCFQMARGGGERERAPYCVTATAALFRSAGQVGACRISIATAKKQIQDTGENQARYTIKA